MLCLDEGAMLGLGGFRNDWTVVKFTKFPGAFTVLMKGVANWCRCSINDNFWTFSQVLGREHISICLSRWQTPRRVRILGGGNVSFLLAAFVGAVCFRF